MLCATKNLKNIFAKPILGSYFCNNCWHCTTLCAQFNKKIINLRQSAIASSRVWWTPPVSRPSGVGLPSDAWKQNILCYKLHKTSFVTSSVQLWDFNKEISNQNLCEWTPNKTKTRNVQRISSLMHYKLFLNTDKYSCKTFYMKTHRAWIANLYESSFSIKI